MTDLVESLRRHAHHSGLFELAADEISRLRADFDALNELLRATCEELDALKSQKPVAWWCCIPGQDPVFCSEEPPDDRYPPGYKEPLYAAPKPGESNGPT